MVDGRQSNAHSRRSNYSYIEEQNEARTELLNSKVNQLKHLAVQIGEETKYQNKYLKVNIYVYLVTKGINVSFFYTIFYESSSFFEELWWLLSCLFQGYFLIIF